MCGAITRPWNLTCFCARRSCSCAFYLHHFLAEYVDHYRTHWRHLGWRKHLRMGGYGPCRPCGHNRQDGRARPSPTCVLPCGRIPSHVADDAICKLCRSAHVRRELGELLRQRRAAADGHLGAACNLAALLDRPVAPLILRSSIGWSGSAATANRIQPPAVTTPGSRPAPLITTGLGSPTACHARTVSPTYSSACSRRRPHPPLPQLLVLTPRRVVACRLGRLGSAVRTAEPR